MIADNLNDSEVTVTKTKLIESISVNRTKHKAAYEEAMVGYRKESVAKLEQMLEGARSGKEIEVSTGLEEPTSHETEYDCILQMLEMSVREEICITMQQFRQYVMDEWNWKHHFVANTALYMGSPARR